MQFGHAANDDQRRRLDCQLCYAIRQGAECGEQGLLIGLRSVADNGGRRHGRQTVSDHLSANFSCCAYAHVENHGLFGAGKCLPIKVDRAVLKVAGNESDGLGVIAMGKWKAGIGGTTGSSGDARYDFKGNA